MTVATVTDLPQPACEPGSLHDLMANVPGLSYRRLDYWVRCGHIPPARPATGSGTQRLYDPADYPMIRRLLALANGGIPPYIAAPIARFETRELAPGVEVTFSEELL